MNNSISKRFQMKVEQEVLYRSVAAAENLTPLKNRCSYNVNQVTIDASGKLTANFHHNEPIEDVSSDYNNNNNLLHRGRVVTGRFNGLDVRTEILQHVRFQQTVLELESAVTCLLVLYVSSNIGKPVGTL